MVRLIPGQKRSKWRRRNLDVEEEAKAQEEEEAAVEGRMR